MLPRGLTIENSSAPLHISFFRELRNESGQQHHSCGNQCFSLLPYKCYPNIADFRDEAAPTGPAAAKPEDRWSPRRPRTFKPQLGTLRCDGSTPKENEKEVLRERAKRSSVECETARRANAAGLEFKDAERATRSSSAK